MLNEILKTRSCNPKAILDHRSAAYKVTAVRPIRSPQRPKPVLDIVPITRITLAKLVSYLWEAYRLCESVDPLQ